MADILWCCHVRGPDEVYAAPNYETALRWADICLTMDRKPRRNENEPYLSAVVAPYPHGAASFAENLPKSLQVFASRKS